MSKKLITAPRLVWTVIVVVIILALLFLPGIRKPTAQQQISLAPAKVESTAPSPSNASAPMPADARELNPTAAPSPGDAQGRLIHFRVEEASTGRPIENAALLVGLYAAIKEMQTADAPHTDKDGRCSIAVPAPPSNVVVRAATYVSRRLVFSKPEDYPEEYTFKLEKGSSIGGYVRDESGKPIADVKLAITSSNPALQLTTLPSDRDHFDSWVPARTDASGHWTAREVDPNPERIFLALDHPDYGTTQFTTDPVSESTTVMGSNIIRPTVSASLSDLKEGKAVLVMKSGLLVAGTVMDESGRGIGGAELNQFEKNPPGGVYYLAIASAKTEGDGRFAFRSLKAGEIVLAVQAKGFAPEYHTIKVAPRVPEIEFRLKKGKIVSGRVVDDTGKPVEGATIRTEEAGA